MLQKSISQKFLDKFTREIILAIVRRLEERERQRLEEQRRLARIKLEKLRKRFEKYGQKKEPQKAPPIKQVIVQPTPVQPKVEQKPVQKIVSKPQIPKQIQPIIKPLPGEIDFGRIMHLVKDPQVSYIECSGEGKNIIIKRNGNTLLTQIKLSQGEIRSIIKSFSEKAKIPLLEGMLNARVDNLEISAVVSDVISPSFILKKFTLPPMPNQPAISTIEPSKGLLQRIPLPQYFNPQKTNIQK